MQYNSRRKKVVHSGVDRATADQLGGGGFKMGTHVQNTKTCGFFHTWFRYFDKKQRYGSL